MFYPQVEPPVPRMRPGFALALVATVAFALGVIAWDHWVTPPSPARSAVTERAAAAGATARPLPVWQGCTALEVEQVIRAAAMSDVDRVTCLAVAGKLDRARALLLPMGRAQQSQAIAQVFNVAHPIADRGDDESAGPIMALVVEFWPDNYMAVFHAGMAEFALGHDDAARAQLQRFLGMYASHDVWRARAEQALAAMATHTPLDQRIAHFPE